MLNSKNDRQIIVLRATLHFGFTFLSLVLALIVNLHICVLRNQLSSLVKSSVGFIKRTWFWATEHIFCRKNDLQVKKRPEVWILKGLSQNISGEKAGITTIVRGTSWDSGQIQMQIQDCPTNDKELDIKETFEENIWKLVLGLYKRQRENWTQRWVLCHPKRQFLLQLWDFLSHGRNSNYFGFFQCQACVILIQESFGCYEVNWHAFLFCGWNYEVEVSV